MDYNIAIKELCRYRFEQHKVLSPNCRRHSSPSNYYRHSLLTDGILRSGLLGIFIFKHCVVLEANTRRTSVLGYPLIIQ
ncbi:hypothetical protein T05_9077 [Trichinella murrelli]|uniref:Uncharacterized protein n=1 Tax=Trichinella murrelli TaxID=144512 RepID=A0A0V0UDB5_9BILA|nr:hypothetical protein T05_9077 [Trichinella murrelli]